MKENDPSTPNPVTKFFKWYDHARTGRGTPFSRGRRLVRYLFSKLLPWSSLFRPDIATLATVTSGQRPAARSVLFKGFVHGGFSFYTDYLSDKGKELASNPSAVLVFYWHLPPRQVRVDGNVVKLSREMAKADWKARKRENQIASAAVHQSSPIDGREELVERAAQIKRRYKGRPIPCPPSWGGYALIPEKMEFWQGRLDWIHHRERYVLENGVWERVYLAP